MVYLVYSHIDRINTSQTLSGSPHATEPQNRNSFCDMRTVTVHRLFGNAAVPGAAVGRSWTFLIEKRRKRTLIIVRRMLTVPKTALAGVILETSFARFIAPTAVSKEERTPSRRFDRWGFVTIVDGVARKQ